MIHQMQVVIAALFAIVISVRCICVAVGVSPREFMATHGRMRWRGFSWSYILLGGAAWFALLDIHRDGGSLALWAFLIASAGLVLFDPRRPKL